MMHVPRQRMHISLVSGLLLILHLFLYPVSAYAVPYTPSHVLASPLHNDSLVYLLLPGSSDGDGQTPPTTFLSLNVSQNVDSGSPAYTTLLDQVPFHSQNPTVAFVPVIDQRGTIKMYTGDCQNPSNPGVLWKFTPDLDSPIGNGTWEQLGVTAQNNTQGPSYLAAGFAYAVNETTESSFYSFGGMCPYENGANASWIAAANYSDAMTMLAPSDSSSSYHLETVGQRAPPIAEAGFAVTPLQPSYTTTTKEGTLQRQDFLFVGGQTQEAFLNMSELAVYSLPQNSWNFVAVQPDPTSAKTELAVRDSTPNIEPRSGHTAVLSSDGSKIIVLGGWVDNTSVPANPQLAILELATGYGGYGSWAWTIPDPKDSFLADGGGIYGHGTAMLPGDVMMIVGGYPISKSPKRSTSNSQVHFYNVSSNSWATSYTNPHGKIARPSQASSTSLSTAKKVGIGVGVGVGVPVLLAIGVLAFKGSRRYRFRRRRDSELRKLALGAQRSHFWGRDTPEMSSSIRGPSSLSSSERIYPWATNRGNGKNKRPNSGSTTTAEKTGLLTNGLSSTIPDRQTSNNAPSSYRYAGANGEHRRHDTLGTIHPIDERDELEASASDSLIAHDPNPTPQSPPRGGLLEEIDIPDPFLEAPFLTPQSSNIDQGNEDFCPTFDEQHHSLANIVNRQEDDRSTPSPDKERPTSNQSNAPKGIRLGVVPKNRATILQGPPQSPSNGHPSPSKSVAASTHSKGTGRTRGGSTTTGSSEKRYSSDSFSTAYTTQSQRQAEGEHLLREGQGGVLQEPVRPLELPFKVAATSRPKASEWIGSMRRVFTGTRRWAISDKQISGSKANSFASLVSGVDRRSAIIEPNKTSQQDPADDNSTITPRRAVSASAELFRRKQGAKDWAANTNSSRPASRETVRTSLHDNSTEADPMLDSDIEDDDDDSDDWDIESAAEGRRVQVTFTVPKERLRVVNATARDADSASEASLTARNRTVSG